MKKVLRILFSFVLVCVLAVPVLLSGCDMKNNGNKQPNTNTEASAASVVMEEIAEELQKVSNSMAKSVSDTITEEDVDDNTSEPTAVVSDAQPVTDDKLTWSKNDVIDYMTSNEYPMGLVFSMDFIVKNATVENGYANGFEYNKVYTGESSVYGTDGIVSMIVIPNVESGKVYCNFDFVGNIPSTDLEVKYVVDMDVDYDFANDKAKKLTISIADVTLYTFFNFAVYDFDANHYSFMEFDGYFNTAAHVAQGANNITQILNSETSTFNDWLDCVWTHVNIVDGNITDNPNYLNFYSYYCTYRYSNNTYITSQTITQDAMASRIFSTIQRNFLKLKIRTTDIDVSDEYIVTYIKDASNYGFSKSSVYSDTRNGKTSFYYPFLEFETMDAILKEAKDTIDADTTASTYTKEVIASAYGYVHGRGKTGYTMNLGTYNGITTSLSYATTYGYNENNQYVCTGIKYTISCTGYATAIGFVVKNGNLVENSLMYINLTGDFVDAACDKAIEYYNYWLEYYTERGDNDSVNYCNNQIATANTIKDVAYGNPLQLSSSSVTLERIQIYNSSNDIPNSVYVYFRINNKEYSDVLSVYFDESGEITEALLQRF